MAGHHNSIISQLLWRPQSRTQSMPVRRLGAGPNLRTGTLGTRLWRPLLTNITLSIKSKSMNRIIKAMQHEAMHLRCNPQCGLKNLKAKILKQTR